MASFEPASWVQQANAVEFEEYERGSKCGPFVAVHKWVVLTENGISRPTAGNHRGFSDNPKSKIENPKSAYPTLPSSSSRRAKSRAACGPARR